MNCLICDKPFDPKNIYRVVSVIDGSQFHPKCWDDNIAPPHEIKESVKYNNQKDLSCPTCGRLGSISAWEAHYQEIMTRQEDGGKAMCD